MTDPTLADLREELREHADVVVPDAPIAELLASADEIKRTRSRRILIAVAAGVVAIVGLAATIAGGIGHDDRVVPSDQPTSTSTDMPPNRVKSLEDLPQGKPSDLIHLMGRTLYLGDKTVTLPRQPIRMLPSGSKAVVQYDDFSIDAVDLLDGRTRKISGEGSGIPVVSHGGLWIAYEKPGTGKNPVVVVDTVTRETPSAMREATFPAVKSCCDNPFQLYGMDQSGMVAGGTPMSGDFTWVTRHDGRGGLPGEPTRLFGPGGRRVLDVTEVEIVVTGPAGIEIGQLVQGQGFVPNDRFELDGEADFEMPSRVLLMNADGLIRLRERTHQVRSPRAPEHEVVLNLPELREFPGVHWENYPNDDGSRQVVLDVSAYSSGLDRDAQVRCDTNTGECEIAAWYEAVPVVTGDEFTVDLRPQSSAVTDEDLTLVRELVSIARNGVYDDPQIETFRALVEAFPFADRVQLGKGLVLRSLTHSQLAQPKLWEIDVDGSDERDGVLSAVDQINLYISLSSDSSGGPPFEVFEGDHPRCATGAPLKIPGVEGLRRISFEPASAENCLGWFSISLYQAGDGKITAVTLDRVEP